MEYEKEYIDYLIQNKSQIDLSYMDSYLMNEIDFEDLLESIKIIDTDLQSYEVFVKSMEIKKLLE